jgi:hypothetical protein
MGGFNNCGANFKGVIVITMSFIIQLNENHLIKHANVIDLHPTSILVSSGVLNNFKGY